MSQFQPSVPFSHDNRPSYLSLSLFIQCLCSVAVFPLTSNHLQQCVIIIIVIIITADKGGGKCFCACSFVCLSVCLLARLLKNACMDLDEMLRVDKRRDMDELINF